MCIRDSIKAVNDEQWEIVRLPLLPRFGTPSTYVPNVLNLQNVNGTLLIPDPLFEPIRSRIETLLDKHGYMPGKNFHFVDTEGGWMEGGNAHCMTLPLQSGGMLRQNREDLP